MKKGEMAQTGSSDWRHELGAKGEELAAAYVSMRGMSVLEKRFRRRGGEIDLICRDECVVGTHPSRTEIVFVEVKTRSSLAFGRPEAGLSRAKRRRILRTAEQYLHEHRLAGRYARIDVVAILFDRGELESIRHYRDALASNDVADRDFWNDRLT